jgi:hypothetical protein
MAGGNIKEDDIGSFLFLLCIGPEFPYIIRLVYRGEAPDPLKLID